MLIMTDDVREVLSRRSVRNKIAVPVDCRLCPVHLLPVISRLVREGVLVWLDRCTIEYDGLGLMVDVYLLTRMGSDYCDEHGIEPR